MNSPTLPFLHHTQPPYLPGESHKGLPKNIPDPLLDTTQARK